MIRPVNAEDAAAIADLWNWMIRETLATFTSIEKSPQEIADLITARPHFFFVAETVSGFAGFATCGPFRTGPGYAATCEHTVIVAPHQHRAGIGHALMARLEAAGVSQKMHVFVAAISSANPAAIRFHTARGYTETGRMPQVGRKKGQWLDLVLMQKNLQPDA